MSNITLVTGLWDINRGSLSDTWKKPYQHYLDKLSQLLEVPYNLIIFGDKELNGFVFQKRSPSNTQFIERSLEWFKNDFFEKIQTIRTTKEWLEQVYWLSGSTQASLEYYNPVVMSKVFLLNDARIMDRFNSTHLYWIDAGITNTVHPGYFTKDKVLDHLNESRAIQFIAFPYQAEKEVHGFDYHSLCQLSTTKTTKVCRGGFFGGSKSLIEAFNTQYYHLMSQTLNDGLMGTEESLFTILLYQYPDQYGCYNIESNGLVYKFFEDLKKNQHQFIINQPVRDLKVALYILTFNSPKQLALLIESMLAYDINFVNNPELYVLDNSTNLDTTTSYQQLCDKYKITYIKMPNLGICGGRQYIAEHAADHQYDYYYFFEDDMFFYNKDQALCRNGLGRIITSLYQTVIDIMQKKSYDFLKLSFTEFYGDNKTQWAWYNVPQTIRELYWPQKPSLPVSGLDPTAPLTLFKNVQSLNQVSWVDGEIYYCNWPQIVSKEGNRKMFLDTKWSHPYEQVWMSHIYQETRKDNIKGAVLLLSPIEHQRLEFYDKSLRKES